MPTLQSTQSFSTGQTLTASALTNHVVDATPLPDFIEGRESLTSVSVSDQDEFMVNDVDADAVKKITLANIAAALPATTASSLTVNGNATVTGTLTNTAGMTTSTLTTSSTATIGGTLTASGNVVVNGNTTLGTAAVTGTYSRSTTTLTVTKVAHGLVTSDTRWFSIENNAALSGSYSVTKLTDDTFTITVANSGATTGNVSWYEKTTTLQGTLAGNIQGSPTVTLTNVSDAAGDSVLIRDASDSGKLKAVQACLPKVWGCISIRTADTTTVTTSYTVSSNTVSISKVAHGLKVGDVLYLNFPSTTYDGWYSVSAVTNADEFQVVVASGLANGNVSWYALSVSGSGISSAFKSSTTDNTAQINLSNAMANTNYAIVATFSREDSFEYGTTSFNYIGATGFDKTTRTFSISTRYTTVAVNAGSIMFTVFGDLA
jgi:hypothetical protein